MEQYTGKAIFQKIAIGRIWYYSKEEQSVKRYKTEESRMWRRFWKTVQMMAGKKVIIHTLDIGADKQVDYFNLDKEENPAMLLSVRNAVRKMS